MQIIAICGRRRSGKDTLADALVAQHGYVKFSFATPIKQIVQTVFGFSTEQLHDDEKDKVDSRWNISPRYAMQIIGTELFQFDFPKYVPSSGRTIWAQALLRQFEKPDAPSKIVIADMRFLHEYQALHDWCKEHAVQCTFVRVTRAAIANSVATANSAADLHPSEKESAEIPVNVVIENDGTLEDFLYNAKNKILNTII